MRSRFGSARASEEVVSSMSEHSPYKICLSKACSWVVGIARGAGVRGSSDVGLGRHDRGPVDPRARERRCPRGGDREASPADQGRAARGAQRAAARGGRAPGRAAARGGRRRVGQDPGADPADRLADHRAQGPPGLDPGDHLHQQGRRRDEGARRGAGRQARADHVGQHLPLRLRADPAQGDRQARLQVELLDLRRRRLQAADDAGAQGPRPRPQALPARRRPALGQQPQERAARPRGRRQGHPQPVRGVDVGGVHDVPAPPARGQRPRLRRPDHVHRPPVPAVPGRPRDLPPPVPPRAGRRVPGHQPRAVRPDPPALRRPDGGDAVRRATSRPRRRPTGSRRPS